MRATAFGQSNPIGQIVTNEDLHALMDAVECSYLVLSSAHNAGSEFCTRRSNPCGRCAATPMYSYGATAATRTRSSVTRADPRQHVRDDVQHNRENGVEYGTVVCSGRDAKSHRTPAPEERGYHAQSTSQEKSDDARRFRRRTVLQSDGHRAWAGPRKS